MPHIVFGGVKYLQVRHAVQCMKCHETIESRFPNDLKKCKCNAIEINGGIADGNYIKGDPKQMEDKRVFCGLINGNEACIPQHIIDLLLPSGLF